MNEITQTQTQASASNKTAFFFIAGVGAALATGQAGWPEADLPYVIERAEPSYSEGTERVLAGQKDPTPGFVDQISLIFASFSQRQQPLGEEFEAAIFDDLDSLYEA